MKLAQDLMRDHANGNLDDDEIDFGDISDDSSDGDSAEGVPGVSHCYGGRKRERRRTTMMMKIVFADDDDSDERRRRWSESWKSKNGRDVVYRCRRISKDARQRRNRRPCRILRPNGRRSEEKVTSRGKGGAAKVSSLRILKTIVYFLLPGSGNAPMALVSSPKL